MSKIGVVIISKAINCDTNCVRDGLAVIGALSIDFLAATFALVVKIDVHRQSILLDIL